MNEKANYAEVVWKITKLIQETQSLEEALRISLEEVVKAVYAETGTIWFYNREGDGKIYPSFWIGKTDLNGMNLNLGEGIAGFVIKEGTSIIIKDCQKDERWAGHFDKKTGFITKSMICVPLINKYEAVGCIQIINKKDNSLYDEEDLDLCERLAIATTIVMENSNLNLAYINKKSILVSLCDIVKKDRKNGVEVQILRDVNLEIKEGEFWVVLGEDNCGKSALLNIIGGIDQPTKGFVLFEGNDYAKVDADIMTLYRRNSIGFIFKEAHLMPNLTIEENLNVIGALVDNSMSVQEVLERVGLLEKRNYYPTQISINEQQKVAIARAMIKQPRIIIAEEPMANLDYETRVEFFTMLEDILESGTIVLMATSNEEIEKMANGVIYIKDGVITEMDFNKCLTSAKDIKLPISKLSHEKLPEQQKSFFFENWKCYQKLSLYSRIMIKNLIGYKNYMLTTIMGITSCAIFLVSYFILQYELQVCSNISFNKYLYGNSFIDKNNIFIINAIYLIFVASMMILVVYNQMIRHINQHTKELSILRINGFTLKEIKSFICKENAILTFFGLILGNSFGIVLTYIIACFMKCETIHLVCIGNSKVCILATLIVSFCMFLVNNMVLKKIHKLKLKDIISN